MSAPPIQGGSKTNELDVVAECTHPSQENGTPFQGGTIPFSAKVSLVPLEPASTLGAQLLPWGRPGSMSNASSTSSNRAELCPARAVRLGQATHGLP